MKTDIGYQEGRVSHLKIKSEGRLPSKKGLHIHSVKGDKTPLPYPVVIESASSYFRGCDDRDYEPEVEIIETVPQLWPHDGDECGVRLKISYELSDGTKKGGSSYRSRPNLLFEHMIIYRKADNVSLNISG